MPKRIWTVLAAVLLSAGLAIGGCDQPADEGELMEQPPDEPPAAQEPPGDQDEHPAMPEDEPHPDQDYPGDEQEFDEEDYFSDD